MSCGLALSQMTFASAAPDVIYASDLHNNPSLQLVSPPLNAAGQNAEIFSLSLNQSNNQNVPAHYNDFTLVPSYWPVNNKNYFDMGNGQLQQSAFPNAGLNSSGTFIVPMQPLSSSSYAQMLTYGYHAYTSQDGASWQGKVLSFYSSVAPVCFNSKCFTLGVSNNTSVSPVYSYDQLLNQWLPTKMSLPNSLELTMTPTLTTQGVAYLSGMGGDGQFQLWALNLPQQSVRSIPLPVDPALKPSSDAIFKMWSRTHLMTNGDLVLTAYMTAATVDHPSLISPAVYQVFVYSSYSSGNKLLFKSPIFKTQMSSVQQPSLPGYGSFVSGNLLFLNAGNEYGQQQLGYALQVYDFSTNSPQLVKNIPSIGSNLSGSNNVYILPSTQNNFWLVKVADQANNQALVTPVFESYDPSTQSFSATSLESSTVSVDGAQNQTLIPFGAENQADTSATQGIVFKYNPVVNNYSKANLWFLNLDSSTHTLSYYVYTPQGKLATKSVSYSGQLTLNPSKLYAWNQSGFVYVGGATWEK